MEIFTTFTSPVVDASGTDRAQCRLILYVGKHQPEFLNNLSVLGYRSLRAENLFMAREQLILLAREQKLHPVAILCDLHFPIQELRAFLSDLNAYPPLQAVPFFLLVNRKDVFRDIALYQSRLSRVNDLIFLDSNPYVIDHKIRFYQHFNQIRIHRPISAPIVEQSFGEMIDTCLKRIFDIVVASLLLLALSPIFLLIALAIKIDSRGPIFYVSLRAGRGFRIFKFYKFRTMIPSADRQLALIKHLNQYQQQSDQDPVFIKIKHDPRITRVGRFLRKTSLDELPQLWNVIKGDMSLVGNRPLPIYEAATLTTDTFSTRFVAPAGITGLWQISKSKKVNMSVEERVRLDISYACQRNFISDMRILFATPFSMFQKEEI